MGKKGSREKGLLEANPINDRKRATSYSKSREREVGRGGGGGFVRIKKENLRKRKKNSGALLKRKRVVNS